MKEAVGSQLPALRAEAAGTDSLQRAYEFLAELQHPTGYWEGEMVWNSMLLSQWVIVQKIVGRLD
ncbi:MAG: Squalene-hopene cyclase N-terminal domain, partial [bacterium]|nr:Squalene-hopene cyclase N-terminal domain [bacterium]